MSAILIINIINIILLFFIFWIVEKRVKLNRALGYNDGYLDGLKYSLKRFEEIQSLNKKEKTSEKM